MVLFQPPPSDPTPWDVGEQRFAETFLWIVAIIGIIWAFLLIVSYINTRKRHHLLWGASFSIMWIAFHQVIAAGDYEIMLGPVMSAMLAFIPGLLAAGLLMVVFSEKKIIGNLYALFVLIMAGLIALFKFDPFYWIADGEEFEILWGLPQVIGSVPGILVMVLHIPSALLIVILPLYTIIKKQTRWPAIFMTIGGLLFGAVGLLLVLVTMTPMFDDLLAATTIDFRFAVMGLFSIFLLVSVLAFSFGTLIPAKWNFDIPGIEFEDRA